MKKLAIFCAGAMIVCFMSGTTLAQTYSYCKDFLESGNPGGWTSSLQTYDDEWTLGVGEEVDVDIWINDLPESLITGGAWLIFDPAKISVVSVAVYELGSPTTPGPWDPGFTTLIPDADGPGTYFIVGGNFGTVAPGPGGDIIISKVRFRREAAGGNIVTIQTIPGFDTITGASLPTVIYDPDIIPNTVIGICTVDGDCDDSNPCTDDNCNAGVCEYTNNTNPCDDGLYCTEGDQCSAGLCSPGTGRDCSVIADQCNDGICDEAADQCVPLPVVDGTGCDDGLYCTLTDECQGGVCVGADDTCPDDANECTDDCDEATDTCYLCNATGTSDLCCEDPVCASEDVCLVSIDEFYVDGTNGDNLTGDGLTPATAWKTITYALNTIPTLVTLGENSRALVHVLPSVYDPIMGGGDAETFPLIMVKYISLVGDAGYSQTIIDAHQTDNVIEFTKEEESGDTITLEGFTITGGFNFRGAGITVLWADPTIRSCNIRYNASNDINGGGIYLQRSNATIIDCIVANNTAFQQKGGGISFGNESNATIISCTVADNTAGCGIDEGGGGISVGHDSIATIVDTIVWGNDLACSPDPVPDQILAVEGSVVTVNYSCIEDGWSGAGAGNTDLDPLFVGSEYHLMFGSSCIDSGDSDLTSSAIPGEDIDGNARYDHCPTPNTGVGTIDYYDRGAREFLGDSDLDGILDDGDDSCIIGDNPCSGGETEGCDDSCTFTPNPGQEDEGDSDGAGDVCDNCPVHPNAALIGTCVKQHNPTLVLVIGGDCVADEECTGPSEFCDLLQLDSNSNGQGDICECEGNFNCDDDVDGSDAIIFKEEFGRSPFFNPCTEENPCPADFDQDGDVDGSDALKFKEDFGRSEFDNPCPPCP